MTEWLEIGRIVAPQGLDGSLRVYPESDFPERFLEPGERWIRRTAGAEPEPVQLVSGRYLSGKRLYVIKLTGIDTREQAESLRDTQLLVPDSDRPALDPGEFYVSDLIGLQVRLKDTGKAIGTVVDIYSAGNDLLAVELSAISQGSGLGVANPRRGYRKKSSRKAVPQTSVLIPFVHEIVPIVNLEAGYVEICPPNGLLPVTPD